MNQLPLFPPTSAELLSGYVHDPDALIKLLAGPPQQKRSKQATNREEPKRVYDWSHLPCHGDNGDGDEDPDEDGEYLVGRGPDFD